MSRYLLLKLMLLLLSLPSLSQSLLWTKTEHWGDRSTAVKHINTDSQNNVYIAGGFGGYITGGGMFMSKYDALGNQLWSDTLSRANFNCGLAIDSLGNSYNFIYHFPGFHFVKYSTTGTKLLDVMPFSGSLTGNDIQIGKDGYIYLRWLG